MIEFHNGWEHDLKVGQDGESEFSNLLRKDRPFYTVECKRDPLHIPGLNATNDE